MERVMNRKYSAFLITVCLLFVFFLLAGCEGASRLDKESRDKLDKKIQEWNTEGNYPTVEPDKKLVGALKEWHFKYAKLFIVLDSQVTDLVDQRYVSETLANEWWKIYPENIKPRFTLEVRAFKDMEEPGNELGFIKILKDGTMY
jgi:hypothetical protein